MNHSLSLQLAHPEIVKSNAIIAKIVNDPSIAWEKVSSIISGENQKILRLLAAADRAADDCVERSTDSAISTGMYMLSIALKHTDPEYIIDLHKGYNVFVKRIREQASEGRIMPMDYMDPLTREELFLIESYMRAAAEDK